MVRVDGTVELAYEFLHSEKGVFPLWKNLLNMIRRQLNKLSEANKDERCEFIKSIARSTKNSKKLAWRTMHGRAAIKYMEHFAQTPPAAE
jgi:hypothetical protein